MSEAVRTTCAYCGVGCGILATRTGERSVDIKGDPDHPANAGRLCSKGTHLGETVGLEGRLLHPMIGDKRATWDKALDLVAKRFRDTIARHGPNSVAFYVSGQLLTEDYYVANKLMKGFIGSGNIDTNSRLCMSSAVAGHIRAFGEDVVPASYDDLDAAARVVRVGCHTAGGHPGLGLPGRDGLGGEPHRQAPAPPQAGVVLAPVRDPEPLPRDAVAAFGIGFERHRASQVRASTLPYPAPLAPPTAGSLQQRRPKPSPQPPFRTRSRHP